MVSCARRDGMRKSKLSFILIALALVVFSGVFFSNYASAELQAPQLTYELKGQVVNLSWAAVPNAIEYKVYYSTDNVTFTLLNTTTNLYYTYTQPWNTTYYYYVIAANATAESAHSNIVKVVTPNAPAAGAGLTSSDGIVIAVYTPFLWLGVFFFVLGIGMVAYGRTSRKRKTAEGFGVLLVFLGIIIMLASVVLPTAHML